jgi:hypothetical protein
VVRTSNQPSPSALHRLDRLAQVDAHAGALDQLAPDRDELLLARVEHRQERQVLGVVGLGHDQLALGVARDRRRDLLLLLEEHVGQPALDAGERRRQPAGARADDRDVDGGRPAPRRRQAGPQHLLDHRAPEVGGVLDQGLAGDLADQVLAGHAGLVGVVELGDLERRWLGALGEHHQGLGRAGPHAGLALDAVVEPEHPALVVDQIEDVGRAHRDAGVAAGAAIVVDVVDQDPRAGDRAGDRGRRALRAPSMVNSAITAMASPPKLRGTTQDTRPA